MCHQVYVCTLFNIFTMCHLVAWVVFLEFIDCQRIFFFVCVVVELFDSSSFCWFAVITTFVVHIVQPLNTIDSRILKDFIRCNCSRYYLVHTQEFFITFDDTAVAAGFFSSSVHRQTSSLLWLISCILNILTKVIEKSM